MPIENWPAIHFAFGDEGMARKVVSLGLSKGILVLNLPPKMDRQFLHSQPVRIELMEFPFLLFR